MEDNMNSKKRYMPGIDGLRALSVLAVIAYHLNMKWAQGGLIGVAIFFVISGYLITDQILIQKQRHGRLDLKDFWIRRARRLLPAMFCMLLFVAIWLLLLDPNRLNHLQGDYLSSLFYVNNWWLIFHQVSYFESFGPPSPIGHLWSLSIEEQFYLIWPLLLLLTHRRGKLFVMILIAAVASALAMAFLYVPGSDPSRVYYGTDTRMFGLLIGAALAVVWPSHKLNAAVSKASRFSMDAIGGISIIALIAMMHRMNEYDASLYRGGFLGLSLLTAIAIAVLAHPASFLAKAMGLRPLKWIGVRSYSLYIWHYPIIILTNPSNQAVTPGPLLIVVQIAASFALAALSYKYVEEPLRRGSLRAKFRTVLSVRWLGVQPLAFLIIIPLLFTPSFGSSLLKATSAPVTVVSDNIQHDDVKPSPPSPTPPPAKEPENDAIGETPDPHTDKPDTNTETSKPTKNETPDPTKEPVQTSKPEHTPEPSKEPEADAGATKDSSTEPPQKGSDDPNKPPVETIKPPVHQTGNGKGITVIGDSVILDAAPFLEKGMPGIVVDGKVGRQMRQAQDVINQMKADHTLGSTVVLELGTNGAFTNKQLKALIESLDQVEHIYLVNTRVPRNWQDTVNQMLPEVAKAYGNVTIVDWYSASEGKEDYFAKDGVHLKREGAEYYASMLIDAISK
ncbi:peptidoglycan-N-acetylmuramate O-acetyltransferase [Paenibacillus sp. BK033]|uniref:acyltransferase family protein n=1 Tax=Paenibacillus sp. BK033 TaxID=2512133 RepID=UPI001044D60C|nr:acyltransferase family protein [Paenibacillus sp. BK033]TCM96218.1 peptidoglycan-N-acetylmuramate O-acetyltransferase [Paenibacillus sp. BK033]